MEDRLSVGFDLLDDRLIDLIGKATAHAAHPVAHIGGGIVGIATELEANGDLVDLLAADRGDEVDPLDARQSILEHLGHLGLNDRSARARIRGLHGHDGGVDRRIFAYAEPLIGTHQNEHEREAQDRGDHRPSDGKFGERTAQAPVAAIVTGTDVFDLSWPAVTTWSPAASPSTISTRPSRRVPTLPW